MIDGGPSSVPTALNGYDAAQDTSARSTLIFPRNSRVEYNRWGRRRILEKQRALEANFGIITRIKNKFGRGVAGRGIFPYPRTADEEWNGMARELMEVWGSNPALYSVDASRDMWEDQRLVAEQLGAGDGEFFEALTTEKSVQPLDPFEIETPWGTFGEYEDGVKTNAMLRPIEYACRTLPSPIQPYNAVWNAIPAESMIHLFRRRRAKHLRGLPPLYSVINDGIDAMDWIALEKATDKLHAALGIAKIVKSQNAGNGLTKQIGNALGGDGSTPKLTEKFWQGAAIVELEKDEDLKLLSSSRPGTAALEGIKFLCHLVALGADLPLSVVMTFAGLGGTPTRAELEDAQNTFDLLQDQIVWRHSQRIYVWRMAIAQRDGEIRKCRDPYWWRCDWHGPAKITVDYGRTASANIDLVRAGMMSVPRYCEERNLDSDSEMDKQIAWLKRAQQRCEAEGVDFDRFFEATPGAASKPTNVPQNQPEE